MGSQLPSSVSFGDTTLSIVDQDGAPWITSADLARALGYSREDAVSKLYARNAEEFTDQMALTVNLTVRGAVAPKEVRIFSPRGCHLVAMFARTERAAAFRRWVLDVLESLTVKPERPAGELDMSPTMKELLRAYLESMTERFCGPSREKQELQTMRGAMMRMQKEARTARLALNHLESTAKRLLSPAEPDKTPPAQPGRRDHKPLGPPSESELAAARKAANDLKGLLGE